MLLAIAAPIAGGRVSDSFDRRVLTTYLEEYLGDFLFDTFQPFHFYVLGADGGTDVPPAGPRVGVHQGHRIFAAVQSPEVNSIRRAMLDQACCCLHNILPMLRQNPLPVTLNKQLCLRQLVHSSALHDLVRCLGCIPMRTSATTLPGAKELWSTLVDLQPRAGPVRGGLSREGVHGRGSTAHCSQDPRAV